MQLGTLIKLGSLAFGVVNDEKIQTLVKMAHNGAKRRGLLQPPQPPAMQTRRPPRRPYGYF